MYMHYMCEGTLNIHKQSQVCSSFFEQLIHCRDLVDDCKVQKKIFQSNLTDSFFKESVLKQFTTSSFNDLKVNHLSVLK